MLYFLAEIWDFTTRFKVKNTSRILESKQNTCCFLGNLFKKIISIFNNQDPYIAK
jgi:hypothetical protein